MPAWLRTNSTPGSNVVLIFCGGNTSLADACGYLSMNLRIEEPLRRRCEVRGVTMYFLKAALVLCVFQLFCVGLRGQSKCDDRLRMAIWRTLDQDILSGPWDCRKVLTVKPIKLGTVNAFIVRGYGMPFCGATGNCSTWILTGRGKRFRIILNPGSVIETIDIKKRGRNRYPDLTFSGRMAADDHYLGTYRFKGSRYRLRRCVEEVYSVEGERSIVRAKKEMCRN